ncbi:MAG: SH3 domain-containing protein [Micropruina sp.]|nr:SH3 domain-containing protein [Micropruina sp.]
MPSFSRGRRARRSWRSTVGERIIPIGLAVAAFGTAGALVITTSVGATQAVPSSLAPSATTALREVESVSRSLTRSEVAQPVVAEAVALLATKRMFVKGAAVIRTAPKDSAAKLGTLKRGASIEITPETSGKYRQVRYAGKLAWALDSVLVGKKPAPLIPEGTSLAPCNKSASIESRIRPDTKLIFRSVCALFPGVNSYGGWRAGGLPFHRNGRAIDIMLTPGAESAMGWQIAQYLVKHAREFNIDHIIFEQKIWTPSTPRWRGMADRGGMTANHMDHVHVAVRA